MYFYKTMQEPYKHIDLTYLQDFSNGDEVFINEMISLSIEQTDQEVNNLRLALEALEYAKVGQICHKLRSSMGFMGISALLIEKLKQVENLAATRTGEIAAHTHAIIDACVKINKELKAKLKEKH